MITIPMAGFLVKLEEALFACVAKPLLETAMGSVLIIPGSIPKSWH